MSHPFGKLLALAIVLFAYGVSGISSIYAASYDPLHPPNSYRQQDNPQYWKNRLPFPGYWQQDVHYEIKAEVNEKTNIITGEEKLTYWNNSPDTLHEVYFHLYQNAFQPDSYLDELQKSNGQKPRYGKYEKQKKGTEIIAIATGSQPLTPHIDNTIMRINLVEPLLPNTSIEFDILFKTYFDQGSTRRRMKLYRSWGYKHFNGVHWYPRISVYDRKFGWTTDQHLGREFYGDFGTYDVELTFANHYIVGATGELQNTKEVLPDELRQKLDISNFKDKPWNEKPSEVIPYDSTVQKTWKFHAENVHDFAFTADPTYRIGEATWNGVTCQALAQEPHAAYWQNAAEYTTKIIQTYSNDFGRYVYHKMVVADARDGMEYPMLTLDGGKDPTYRGLLAHEVGHNWFFGQVGNNETYRASLDEGFTQFLTGWCLTKLEGEFIPRNEIKNKYVERYKPQDKVMDRSVYRSYITDAMREQDPAINTHSDGFNGALHHGGGYRHVYYKTATMLYNLQYVLGDELFLRAMQHYFNQWKICHPYPEDFRNSIIHYTKVDLNWFFDQWMETSKNIDYGIKSVRRKKDNVYLITFERKGRMQMPLDFRVTNKNGETFDYYIPNTWFTKETTAKTLPKWTGWDLLNPTYEAEVQIPGGLRDVIIDPSGRLADVHMLDNTKKSRAELQFDSQISQHPDWRAYQYKWRPDIWYNAYDGFKFGLHVNGNYMRYKHVFSATAWYNSSLWQGGVDETRFGAQDGLFDPFSVLFSYHTSVHKLIPKTHFHLNGRHLDGLTGFQTGMTKEVGKHDQVNVHFKSMYRMNATDLNYLLYPQLWEAEKFNNSMNVGYYHHYRYGFGDGRINIKLRSSSLLSDYNYATLALSVVNHNQLGKVPVRTRTYAQIGSGAMPPESALYLAGGNPEEMVDNKYTRAAGFIPQEWLGYNYPQVNADPSLNVTHNFQFGGGLNVRGYNGYFIVQESRDTFNYPLISSNSGFGFNMELDFDDLVNIKPKSLQKYFHLDTYLFFDAGTLGYSNTEFDYLFTDIRFDAGVGTAFTIKRWGFLETTQPLTIRFDMPLVLSHPPFNETDFVQFRWVLGINRAF